MRQGTEVFFSKRYMIHRQKSPISGRTNLETLFAFPFFGKVDMPVPVNLYRGKGLSIASEAEKAFREGGREGFFIPFSFSFVLYFFPLAVGQPGLSTQEENEAYLNHFCWYSATCLELPTP